MTEPLESWWATVAADEVNSMIPKVIEYGAHDLTIIGDVLLLMRPELKGKVEPAELGIAFYALGKMARIMGAYADGIKPSDDSWHDLGIYARMAQRVRAADGWPGPVKKKGTS
jgi:hypothetical protein